MTDDARTRRGPRHAAIDVDVVEQGTDDAGADDPHDELDVRLRWPAAGEREPVRAAPAPPPPAPAPPPPPPPLPPQEEVPQEAALEPVAVDVPAPTVSADLEREVPLLPLIVGRVEAVDGQMRTLGMRLDVLASSIGAIRSSIGDRIESYAEMTAASGRRADQVVEDLRRSHDRGLRDLRTGLAATDERVRAVADRVATRPQVVPTGEADAALDARVAGLDERVADAIVALEARVASLDTRVAAAVRSIKHVRDAVTALTATDPATASDLLRVSNALGDLAAAVDAGAAPPAPVVDGDDDVLAALGSVEEALGDVRTLVEVVVDTMPSSAEGSGDDMVDRIAEAVVGKLDLDDLAARVARHLEEILEIVPDAPR